MFIHYAAQIDIPERKKSILLVEEPEQSHFVHANEEISPLNEAEDNRNSRNVPESASAIYFGTEATNENNKGMVSVSESNQKLPIQAKETLMEEHPMIVYPNFSVPTEHCGFQDAISYSGKAYSHEYYNSTSSQLSVLSQ